MDQFKGPSLSHSANSLKLDRIHLKKRGGLAMELVTQVNVAQMPSHSNFINMCIYVCECVCARALLCSYLRKW